MYKCEACGSSSEQWYRQCWVCAAVNTMVPASRFRLTKTVCEDDDLPRLGKVDTTDAIRLVTGIESLDEALGGGFAWPSVVQLTGQPGIGKCLGEGTPVMRYDGTVVPVEAVREGDLLMGPDSTPRTVLCTTRGHGQLFRIVPTKGDPWVCNDVHVLTLRHSATGEIVDVPLNEYLTWAGYRKSRFKLFMPDTVHFSNTSAAPSLIDPYFLGVWLGDGTKDLRGIEVTKPDAEIYAACLEQAQRYGLHVSMDVSNGCPTYSIVGTKGVENPLTRDLRKLMENGVRIPLAYRVGPFPVRAAVLAGLLDTDGHYSCGTYELTQRNPDIAADAAFIARSLGLRVTQRLKTVNGKAYTRLLISGDATVLPMRIARKMPHKRQQIKNVRNLGFEVRPIGEGDYYGFELDGDGRFLLGDFTVTHNSTLLLQIADPLAKRTLYVTSEERVESIAARAKRFRLKNINEIRALATLSPNEVKTKIVESGVDLVIMDSLQGLRLDPENGGGRRHSQLVVRDIALDLITFANKTDNYEDRQGHKVTIVMICHVNKSGDIAGLKEIEHMVDVVMVFGGERSGKRRKVRLEKNRFGPSDKIAAFLMEKDGLHEVQDESSELGPTT